MKCKFKNLEVNYEVYGSGKPVIMLHGSPVDHRIMEGCMEPIFKTKSNYRRIYMDMPGMGKTKGADWIVNLDDMLEVIIDFINNVVPGENFLLAGQSFGGFLARGVIYKMAEKIDGLLLICPAIFLDEKKRTVPPHIVLKRDAELLSKLDPEDAKCFDAIQVVQDEPKWERYRDEVLSGIKIADIDFLENLDAGGFEFSFEVDDINKKFVKPTLMLLGRQDDCVGYKDAWSILESYPRATFAVLDMAGHGLQMEQEELFDSLVNEWLKRVEEF